MAGRACPWCASANTERLGDAGSLLMTEPWYCRDCASAFEVIRKRGSDDDAAGESSQVEDAEPSSGTT